MDKTYLKEKAAQKNLNLPELAKRIGIDHTTLYRKLYRGDEGFSIAETKKIISILGLNQKEVREIFFSK